MGKLLIAAHSDAHCPSGAYRAGINRPRETEALEAPDATIKSLVGAKWSNMRWMALIDVHLAQQCADRSPCL